MVCVTDKLRSDAEAVLRAARRVLELNGATNISEAVVGQSEPASTDVPPPTSEPQVGGDDDDAGDASDSGDSDASGFDSSSDSTEDDDTEDDVSNGQQGDAAAPSPLPPAAGLDDDEGIAVVTVGLASPNRGATANTGPAPSSPASSPAAASAADSSLPPTASLASVAATGDAATPQAGGAGSSNATPELNELEQAELRASRANEALHAAVSRLAHVLDTVRVLGSAVRGQSASRAPEPPRGGTNNAGADAGAGAGAGALPPAVPPAGASRGSRAPGDNATAVQPPAPPSR